MFIIFILYPIYGVVRELLKGKKREEDSGGLGQVEGERKSEMVRGERRKEKGIDETEESKWASVCVGGGEK